MKLEETITLENLKEKDFRNKINGSYAYDESALTHYLHNLGNGIADHYRPGALSAIRRYMEFKTGEEIKASSTEKILRGLTNHQIEVPFPAPENPAFTFIDLFAGIGGFRMALQNLGGKCVFTSEWDKYSQLTYETNFGERPFGDITERATKDYIPDGFNVLCAGFPCQAFSIAGKRGGFEDTRGTLFFDVAEIIADKRPEAIFLENVKGLRNHDKGKTLATILNTLRNDLGYFVPEPKILNAKHFGVPQNRERIFIVGFANEADYERFAYPEGEKNIQPAIEDILEEQEVSVKYYLSNTYLDTLKKHRARHEGKGNGFGFEVIPNDGTANAVVCGGMGRERNLVEDHRISDYKPVTKIKGEVNREGIRKMTPREWARLQGFPDAFQIPVSDVQAYKQFGNSVAVPAIQATALQISRAIGVNHE